jgi:hypothetical protein
MKAKKEHVDKELIVLKLFAINYARDLIYICICTLIPLTLSDHGIL